MHGAVPDPKVESLDPHFDVRLARLLGSLLKSNVDGPDESAVALGARSLSDIFAQSLSDQPLSIDDARSVGFVKVGGFTAWPIFVTYAGGFRDAYGPVYNNSQIEESLRDFYTTGASEIRGAIGEAIRNVAQHGHEHRTVGYRRCLFAPAGVFVKEISFGTDQQPSRRMLMAVVADEGPGISEPERSMVNGFGNGWGDDKTGLGNEMRAALLYLVKSNKGEWCLFDGSRQSNPDKYQIRHSFKERAIGDGEKIQRVASLDLPAPSKGCQKIMFFAHPCAAEEDARDMREQLLRAFESMCKK